MAATFLVLLVDIQVQPDAIDAFRAATVANATASRREAGVVRFDVIQDRDDATRFALVEVYRTPEAHAAHRETEHYQAWRAAVDGVMARPRTARRFVGVSPEDDAW